MFFGGVELEGENENGETVGRCENEKRGGNVAQGFQRGESVKGKPGGKKRSRNGGNGEKGNEKVEHGGKRCGVRRCGLGVAVAVRGFGADSAVAKGVAGARRLVALAAEGRHIAVLLDQKMNDGIPAPFFGVASRPDARIGRPSPSTVM